MALPRPKTVYVLCEVTWLVIRQPRGKHATTPPSPTLPVTVTYLVLDSLVKGRELASDILQMPKVRHDEGVAPTPGLPLTYS